MGGEKGGAEVAQVCEKGVAESKRKTWRKRRGGYGGRKEQEMDRRSGHKRGRIQQRGEKEEEMGHRTEQQKADAGKAERREGGGRGKERRSERRRSRLRPPPSLWSMS